MTHWLLHALSTHPLRIFFGWLALAALSCLAWSQIHPGSDDGE